MTRPQKVARPDSLPDIEHIGAVRFIDLEPPPSSFLSDMQAWLSGEIKRPPAMYLYDENGAQLFEAICATPEYYLTRTEVPLLTDASREIAEHVGTRSQVVEFGAGSVEKIRILVDSLASPAGYVAIDISREQLLSSAADFAAAHSQLDVVAVCADFHQHIVLPWPPDDVGATRLGFFPGSTIGNFSPPEARDFLTRSATILGSGGFFLIGIDLVKDAATLERAYDDGAGVSAAFSLNLAERMSRELETDIDVDNYRYEARFNRPKSRIEMLWRSLRDHVVRLGDRRIAIDEGQELLVEVSYKFTIDGFAELARSADYDLAASWTDAGEQFALVLLRAR